MRRCLVPLLIALLGVPLVAPVGHAQRSAEPVREAQSRITVPYRQFKLANGLNVILHRDTRVPVVAVNVWYHVGSANEKPGRTGFAHLFEHLMFEGSKNVKEGLFDTLLEGAGGDNNGSTTNDRTNYVIDVPKNALDLALFLESDRMAYLLDTMTPERVNGQRDVVKNERRQSYENQPYGMASIEMDKLLWPPNHPYSWPTIGYMEFGVFIQNPVFGFKREGNPDYEHQVIMLTADSMREMWGFYLANTNTNDAFFAVNKAADYSGLPPALVLTAEFDPLRDEGEHYASLLDGADVDTKVVRYDGMIHGFLGMREIVPAANEAMAETAAFLRAHLA